MHKALILAMVAILSGCATITRGTSEVLVVETEPPGAEVSVSPNGYRCTSPCSLEVKRKHNYHVDIRKDGYEPISTDVLSQIAGAGAAGMAGNVLIGGLIGAAIDAGSGATRELKPNPLKVKLVPLAPQPVETVDPQPIAPAIARPTDTALNTER